MRRLAPLLCLLLCGCSYLFPDPRGVAPKPDDHTIVIDDSGRVSTSCPAASASRQLAADRSACWGEISEQIKAGKIRTVSDMAAYSARKDRESADRFNSTVQAWLEQALQGADDDLPGDAADVAAEIRDSFKGAAK